MVEDATMVAEPPEEFRSNQTKAGLREDEIAAPGGNA
jgi:hypothetical protein